MHKGLRIGAVVRVVAALSGGALAFACDPPNNGAVAQVGDNPADTDSLYKLLRRLLVDSNPRPVFQAYVCEQARVSDRLPAQDVERRFAVLMDTVFTSSERQYFERNVDARLANELYTLDKEHCGPDFDETGPARPNPNRPRARPRDTTRSAPVP
jgi:hypothetical protein